MPNRIAILISGRGTNLEALINAASAKVFDATISCVISNRSDAAGIEIAKKELIPSFVVNNSNVEDEINNILIKHEVHLICLAGFMKILSVDFIKKWENKIINIHPSLLPAFKGLNAQKQALDAGVKIAGCTVHHVTSELDSGKIIVQGAVPVLQDDNVTTLSNRILEMEHKCYPLAVRIFFSDLPEVNYIF